MYKMAVLSKIKPHSDAVDYFKELPFYNKPIEKTKVKQLKSIDRLTELPFHEQLSEIKGFKYQIPVKVLLKKYKSNGEICSSVFQLIHKNRDKSQI